MIFQFMLKPNCILVMLLINTPILLKQHNEVDEEWKCNLLEVKNVNESSIFFSCYVPGPPLRFMPLWNKFSSEFIDIIQGAARASFRQHKICWIRGLSYTLLAKAMVGIHIGVHIHLLNVLLCI